MLTWSEIVLIVTYLFQIGILLFLPVPSPVSLDRKILVSKKSVGPDISQGSSAPKLFLKFILAVLAITGAFVPAATLLYPATYKYCVPFFDNIPILPESLLIVLLLSGNIVVFSAVLKIRKSTSFNRTGESLDLVTSGIFRFVQHPMVTGMGMIFLAILCITPCLITAVGAGAFCYHLKTQIRIEEELLLLHFGRSYALYRNKVGRFLPRIYKTKPQTWCL